MERIYDIRWYDTLGSTNDEAARHAGDLDNLSVVAAGFQTSGRGQKGNRWTSEKGMNLTFSIFLRFTTPEAPAARPACPALKATEQFVISEIATIAQCRFLAGLGIDAKIKWPNDIYCGDRKISGMLVENSLSGTFLSTSVVGIGLNVNQTAFPPELPNPTSVKLLTGKDSDVRGLLESFMEIFTGCLQIPSTSAEAGQLKHVYESLLYRRGQEAVFLDISGRPAYLPSDAVVPRVHGKASGTMFRGCIEGISGTGMLRLRLVSGEIREFGFKEIAYII